MYSVDFNTELRRTMLFMELICNVDTWEIGLKNGVYLPVARCFSAGDMCSALVLGDYQINHLRVD